MQLEIKVVSDDDEEEEDAIDGIPGDEQLTDWVRCELTRWKERGSAREQDRDSRFRGVPQTWATKKNAKSPVAMKHETLLYTPLRPTPTCMCKSVHVNLLSSLCEECGREFVPIYVHLYQIYYMHVNSYGDFLEKWSLSAPTDMDDVGVWMWKGRNRICGRSVAERTGFRGPASGQGTRCILYYRTGGKRRGRLSEIFRTGKWYY